MHDKVAAVQGVGGIRQIVRYQPAAVSGFGRSDDGMGPVSPGRRGGIHIGWHANVTRPEPDHRGADRGELTLVFKAYCVQG